MFCLICGSNNIKEFEFQNPLTLNLCKRCNHIIFQKKKYLKESNDIQDKKIICSAIKKKFIFNSILKNKNIILNVFPKLILNTSQLENNEIRSVIPKTRLFEIEKIEKRFKHFSKKLKKRPNIIVLNYFDIYSDPIYNLKNISTIVDKETILIVRINGLRSLISEYFLQKKSNKSFFNFKDEYANRNHLFSIKSICYLLNLSNFKIDLLNFIKFEPFEFFKLFMGLFISTKGDIDIFIKQDI
ncbi:MAG: hypothetical protein JJ848_000365 [Prochlorococcus marinus CUG1439]|uniref:hypothetical protein n=1 Tax=Prochlorococcus sp. MIT 1314 TaxID=3096220 RepID=UPI001B202349|nr:hypothetical protein [Prochlorococcus sp. MIT 1314]MCR8538794.1 hypothetical protein [Prochlorococcus marinus CUG1439]